MRIYMLGGVRGEDESGGIKGEAHDGVRRYREPGIVVQVHSEMEMKPNGLRPQTACGGQRLEGANGLRRPTAGTADTFV